MRLRAFSIAGSWYQSPFTTRSAAGRGTGTASLEAKLLQQLTARGGGVLFKVFMGIWKAYDALDQERALDLLAAYGVDPGTV